MASELKALLLAAGKGTRLRPLTDIVPKCLVPIRGRPVLDFWLEALAQAGCRSAVINSHSHAEKVREYLGLPRPAGYPVVHEFYEPELLGSAGTLTAVAPQLQDSSDVCIIYADQLSDVDLGAMLEFHRGHGDPLTALVYTAPDPRSCGIVETDADSRIIRFEEKPAQPRSNLANGGVYIVQTPAFLEMAAMRGFDIAFDVLPRMIGRMRAWPWHGLHRDIGTPAALQQAQTEFDSVQQHLARRRDLSPAVFFDRDGTLIEHSHYLSEPEKVRLFPDTIETLHRLRHAGYRCVAVTNQSAIGRGMMTDEQYQAVNDEFMRQLWNGWAWLDDIRYCPLAPVASTDRYTVEFQDRKPGPGMLLQAASALRLDLSRSWMIGDMASDVLAGNNAGCCGNILLSPAGQVAGGDASEPLPAHLTAPTLCAAADLILEQSASGTACRPLAEELHS